MKIHHIGYAVKNMEKAITSFKKLGFTIGECIDDESRNVRITFINNEGYDLELVAPLCQGSPIDSILAKNGEGPYHICYITHSMYKTIKDLKTKGFMLIQKPAPALAIYGQRVAFLFSISVGLIEIVETI